MLLVAMAALALQTAPALQDAVLTKDAPKPVPIGPTSWLSDDDYPAAALAKHAEGTVNFALLVDTSGKVTRCRVLVTSGFLDLDQTACAVLMVRAKFKPARDAAGQPVASVFRGSFTWLMPGGSAKRATAMQPDAVELTLAVQAVPASYKQPSLLRLHYAAGGKPDACRAEITSGNASLDKVACEQAMAQVGPPAKRKDGLQPDMQMVSVVFETAK